MTITKIYDRPTVKQVIFQITYPNLFYLENKIGDIQQKIMKEFPISKLLLRSGFVIANVGTDQKIEIPSDPQGAQVARKIWQFESKNKIILSVTSNYLDLTCKITQIYQVSGNKSGIFSAL